VFVVESWTGEVPERNDEGPLAWVPRSQVLDPAALPMWEGDRFFLPLVFDDDPRAFHGVMPYAQGRPTGWRYERC
jgi:8-oxo-dGTP diphosphatase